MARTSPPRWREVAGDLLQRIERGDLAPADGARRRLPPEKELETHYTVSRNTIREALSWLQKQGAVISEQGKGTFVVHRPQVDHVTMSAVALGLTAGGGTGEWYNRAAFIPSGRDVSVSPVKVEIQEVPEIVAWYLQADNDAEFISRHQQLFLDGQPWAMQTSFYPLDFVSAGAPRLLKPRDIPEGAVAYLQESLGYSEVGFHDEIKARVPDYNEKQFFDLGDSAADVVFETVRTAYSESGQAFRLTVTVWPADRTRLHYNDGEVPEAVLKWPGQGSSSVTAVDDDG